MTGNPPGIPCAGLPRHVAIIMDGNGRWAQQRGRPRTLGHRAGVTAMRRVVQAGLRHGIEVLTLFAFSQENWRRPAHEVELLMWLFGRTLKRELARIRGSDIRLRFIGDREGLPTSLRDAMQDAEAFSAGNRGLILVIAIGYGGQWDIVQAAERLRRDSRPLTGLNLETCLATSGLPSPDLLIRTGGEKRLSNFLLWQLAYAELLFVDTLWPDFDGSDLDDALNWYGSRQRRFGRVLDAQ